MKEYSRENIAKEYDESSASEAEFEKVKWGSEEGMNNRFDFCIQRLPFSDSARWLDVGSGTGAFQARVLGKYPNILSVGVELSAKLCSYSESRGDTQKARFINEDFLEMKSDSFDLITCIGVLQKTNFSLNEFFRKAGSLLSQDGILFVDTKNINWSYFKEGYGLPEPSMNWFDFKDLLVSLEKAGLEVLETGGFLPRQGRQVEANDSHTIYLIAQQPARYA